MFILDPGDTSLNSLVKRIVLNFDTDPEIRFKLLSIACHHGAYALERWEVEEMPDKLRDLNSGVWYREMATGYLYLVDTIVSKLRGQQPEIEDSGIISPENSVRSVNTLMVFTPEWLAATDLRTKVEKLRKAILYTLYWFDLQFVASLFLKFDGAILCNYDFEELKSISKVDAVAQLSALADLAYTNGRMAFTSKIGDAYEAVQSVNCSEWLKKLFKITPEQLRLMVVQRRGANISPEEFEKAGAEKSRPVPELQEQKEAWMEHNDLFVPSEYMQPQED